MRQLFSDMEQAVEARMMPILVVQNADDDNAATQYEGRTMLYPMMDQTLGKAGGEIAQLITRQNEPGPTDMEYCLDP